MNQATLRSRIAGAAVVAFLALALFPPTERVVLWQGGPGVLRQSAGHRSALSLMAPRLREDHYEVHFARLAGYWAVVVGVALVALRLARVGLAWGRPIADSLVAGAVNVLGALVAWSGVLGKLGSPGETAAFLAYFIWPVIAIILSIVTSVAARRDWRAGMVTQAALGSITTICAATFTATHFYGWE